MTVTSGFFNSVNGDRKYDAEQFGSIFDGVIKDGVYKDVGDAFVVTAASGTSVKVGTGRAWFNRTWTFVEKPFTLDLPTGDTVLDRYDTVVLEVDKSTTVRKNTIKIISGGASSSPTQPTLTKSGTLFQYPLAHIYRNARRDVTTGDIRRVVGTSSCPYVTSVLESISVDTLYSMWEAQFNSWFDGLKDQETMAFSEWRSAQSTLFNDWFSSLKTTLADDVAANLSQQIVDLQEQIQSLATENALYDPLLDSDGNNVLDSAGSAIMARKAYNN